MLNGVTPMKCSLYRSASATWRSPSSLSWRMCQVLAGRCRTTATCSSLADGMSIECTSRDTLTSSPPLARTLRFSSSLVRPTTYVLLTLTLTLITFYSLSLLSLYFILHYTHSFHSLLSCVFLFCFCPSFFCFVSFWVLWVLLNWYCISHFGSIINYISFGVSLVRLLLFLSFFSFDF